MATLIELIVPRAFTSPRIPSMFAISKRVKRGTIISLPASILGVLWLVNILAFPYVRKMFCREHPEIFFWVVTIILIIASSMPP